MYIRLERISKLLTLGANVYGYSGATMYEQGQLAFYYRVMRIHIDTSPDVRAQIDAFLQGCQPATV